MDLYKEYIKKDVSILFNQEDAGEYRELHGRLRAVDSDGTIEVQTEDGAIHIINTVWVIDMVVELP